MLLVVVVMAVTGMAVVAVLAGSKVARVVVVTGMAAVVALQISVG